MSSTFQRTEPRFGPPPATPAAPEVASQRPSPRLWPWIVAAACAVAVSVPSLAVVPERLTALVAPVAVAVPAARPAPDRSRPTAQGEPEPLVTGTIVTGAAVAAPAVAAPAAMAAAPAAATSPPAVLRLFGVRLAGGESADLLWTHWSELRTRFPGVLDGVGPAVRPLPAAATAHPARFELMAGRYRNAAEAAALCGRLRAHDIPCSVRDLEDIPTGPS